ncbi:MAG: T9SS type A sorting domain-containing protein [Bacteroidia bacterium]|nr:T9SS type A sorting domain-containing protein [Bacteroidia bacterium]
MKQLYLLSIFCVCLSVAGHAQSSQSYILLFDVFDSGGSGPATSSSTSFRALSIVGQAAQQHTSTAVSHIASSGAACVFCELLISTGIAPSVIPGVSRLHQNYPNPFNPTSTIRYELERPSVIEVAVYTLLGRKLKILDSGFRDTGMHSIDVDAAEFGSGVYVYRLRTPFGALSRRMVVLR